MVGFPGLFRGVEIAENFQFISGGVASDIYGIAVTASLVQNTSFVARLYAGTKNVTLFNSVIRITGRLMVFGLGV